MSAIPAQLDRLRRLLAALAVGALVLVPAAGCNDDSGDSEGGEETSETEENGEDSMEEGDEGEGSGEESEED